MNEYNHVNRVNISYRFLLSVCARHSTNRHYTNSSAVLD